jgi:hypothetical protein
VTAPPTTDSLQIGLVAHFPFDGPVIDIANQAHTGITSRIAPALDRFNSPDKAIGLDADSSSCVIVSHSGDLNFAGIIDFTLTLWYKATDTLMSKAGLIAKADNNPDMIGYQLQFDDANTLSFLLGTNRDITRLKGVVPADTAWHFIAVVVSRKHSTVQLFRDGIQIAYQDSYDINGNVDTKAPLVIGRDYGSVAYFTGLIDDVRVYNRALTQTNVRQLYHLGGWQ